MGLSEQDVEQLTKAWLTTDVNRGVEWMTPTVEAIVARHVTAALNEAAVAIESQGGCTCETCETYAHAARIVRAQTPATSKPT